MYGMWPQKETVLASDTECLKEDCELWEHVQGAFLLEAALGEKISKLTHSPVTSSRQEGQYHQHERDRCLFPAKWKTMDFEHDVI